MVLTAFFVPNMLRKGTVDMLLVKPIHRTTLLLYKYVGGLTFVFLNALVAVGGVYVVIGLRTGVCGRRTAGAHPGITFYFAVFYSVSVLFGVLTRSPIVPILITLAVYPFSGPWAGHTRPDVGPQGRPARDHPLRWIAQSQEPIKTTVEVAYTVLPRTKDIDVLTTRVIAGDLLSEAGVQA